MGELCNKARPFEQCPCNHLHERHSLLMACVSVHKGRCSHEQGQNCSEQIISLQILLNLIELCKFFKIMFGIERQKKCLLLGNESPKELISDMLYIDMKVYSDMDLLSRSAGVGSA